MNKLVDLIVFIIVVAVLFWALGVVLTALAIPPVWAQLANVAFVVIVVLSFADYFRSGNWFWRR